MKQKSVDFILAAQGDDARWHHTPSSSAQLPGAGHSHFVFPRHFDHQPVTIVAFGMRRNADERRPGDFVDARRAER